MDRRLGGSAFLFFVLVGLVSNIGGGAGHFFESGNKATEVGRARVTGATPAEAIDADAQRCSVVEVLRRHYGKPEAPPDIATGSDNACKNPAFTSLAAGSPQWESGRILIATVPDPLQTANALEFDRDIAALQAAASTSEYDFESIFTPWDVPTLEEPKEPKAGREAERYRGLLGDKPGAMLFHRRLQLNAEPAKTPDPRLTDDLLLIILVPESATYGLNMHAAHEALDSIEALEKQHFASANSSSADILWIGPNYSASAFGLRRLAAEKHSFNVFSGSITGSTAIEMLKRIDCGYYFQQSQNTDIAEPKGNTLKCLQHYSDTDVTSPGSDAALLHALQESHVLGKRTDEPIALLQEDESSYGSDRENLHDSKHPIRTLYFPRGISHVRSIFGGQFTNYQPTTGEAQVAHDNKSLFDLAAGLQQPLDTAPEFSAQSPHSNEAELAALAFSVQHMHASGIVILATDPLDNLFLARFFRQKLPDTRLVLFGAERLLPALRSQYDLDGTLTVTRFPLFENSYLDTPLVARRPLTFMNSSQEGIFLAALHQINRGPALKASWAKGNERLPIWIGVASGGSFWPLQCDQCAVPPTHSGSDRITDFIITDIPEEPMPGLWVICSSLALLCAGAHVALFSLAQPFNKRLMKSTRPWVVSMAHHRFLTFYLTCTPEIGHTQEFKREFGRRYWMLIATGHLLLVLSYLLVPAALTIGRHLPASIADIGAVFFYTFAVVVTLAASAHFVWLLIDLITFHSSFRQTESRGLFFLHAMALAWLFASLSLFLYRISNSDDGWPFALRCVHMGSGVSPVLPLLFASLGFIVAALVNLNSLALARDRNPQMPEVGLELLQLAPCKEKLASFIEGWGLLPSPYGVTLFLFVLVWCFIAQPIRMFGSLDGEGMTLLFTLNVVFGVWTIVWLWIRFLRIWSLLRAMLEALEGSPLRFAFTRLPKVFSLAPIWSYAGLRRTLILPMRWFEYFKVSPKRFSYSMHLNQERKLLESISIHLFHDQVLIDGDYIRFSREQNDYAATLGTMPAVRASWGRGGPDTEIGRDGVSAGTTEHGGMASRVDVPSPCNADSSENCEVAIANEYIAMRFGAYVRYVTLQLKNLMTFMSVGLLFFLLAAVSYPFRAPRGIAWSLLALVILLLCGVGTVLVQMDRDSILSRMSDTPEKVNRSAFLWHMLSVGGLPVVTAISAIFPGVGNFLFSWLQPLLSTLH